MIDIVMETTTIMVQPGIREPTLGDCWKPMLNDNYLRI